MRFQGTLRTSNSFHSSPVLCGSNHWIFGISEMGSALGSTGDRSTTSAPPVFDGWLVRWIRNWLYDCIQIVEVNGSMSRWRMVMSGVPPGSILVPVLFNLLINDTDSGIKSTISWFADDTKRSVVFDMPEGWNAI
ncbi:hypothetical protein QYF61_027593 [Mycteria americana]|uniref:Reverse transcriptase domain-containing protein n=1 Tax=Mycteria americana TaxID=33587 RepID=A0AAN7MR35_MYCAM|nr:hypothetical protein QYF61_027593 [Mycteria americana]